MAGRPNPLSEPGFAREVAAMVVENKTREEMCAIFGVKDTGTITRWTKDPRVRMHVEKLRAERVSKIANIAEAKILGILNSEKELTVKEIIEIRREFMTTRASDKLDAADSATVGEAQDFVEDPDNADLIDLLRERVEGVVAKRDE